MIQLFPHTPLSFFSFFVLSLSHITQVPPLPPCSFLSSSPPPDYIYVYRLFKSLRKQFYIFIHFFFKKRLCKLYLPFHWWGGALNLPFVVYVRMLLFPTKTYTPKKKKKKIPPRMRGWGEQDGEGGRGGRWCV